MTGTTAQNGPIRGPASPGTPLFGFSAATVRRALAWGYAAFVAAYIALRLIPLPPVARAAAPSGLLVLLILLSLSALTGAYAQATGVERRFWGLACVSGVLLALGRGYDLVAGVLGSSAASATTTNAALAGVTDTAAVVGMLVLLLVFSRFRHASLAARARYIIDVVTMCLVIAGALEFWVVGPWLDHVAPGSWWARFVFSGSPVVGGLALVGLVGIVFGTRIDRWESWERVLAGSITLLALGLLLAPLAYADTVAGIAGGWLSAASDLVWMTGIYLALTGAAYRHLESRIEWRLRPLATLEPSYGWVPIVALPVAEALSLPLLGYAATQAAEPRAQMARIIVVGAVAVTIAARTLITVMDTDELTAGVVTDPLTGLYNHRHFQARLAAEVASAVRFGESVSLIALDVDDFARVNAAAGHGAGDSTLIALARAIDRAVRSRDVVCRLGGDELAVILPGTDAEAAVGIAERMLAEIREVTAPNGRRVTTSAGLASLPVLASDAAELLSFAEAALYEAKRRGKDCAVLFEGEGVAAMSADERQRMLHARADHATVSALAAAVDARDEATQDHSRNVARYAVMLGREMGLDERTLTQLEYAGILHDVGKVGLPDSLLRKPGALAPAERARMQSHAVLGAQILQSTTMNEILPLVRHHHERWDGQGYPDGLAGRDIPLGARILALANAYDAMRSDRPHRPGLSRSAALQEIDLGLGNKYDPELGELFIDAIGRTYL